MKNLELKDLKPQEAELEVNGKTYALRPVTLDDWSWMQTRFGKQVQEIMNELPLSELTRICFRLLRDKKDFLPEDVEEYDDDGELIKFRLTGPQKLARAFEGISSIQVLTQAFLKAMGFGDVSDEDIETIAKENESEGEKKSQ